MMERLEYSGCGIAGLCVRGRVGHDWLKLFVVSWKCSYGVEGRQAL